jgi:hypothetical protein
VVGSSADEQDIFAMEVRLIAELDTFAHRHTLGCNFTLGGEGTSGHRVSIEERRRRSERQTGDGNSAKKPEVRRHISEALTGQVFTQERCDNISVAMTGKKQSPETCDKKSMTMLSEPVQTKLHKAHAQRNAHLIPIHRMICELTTQGLTIAEIIAAVKVELRITIRYGTVTNVRHVHKTNQCETCKYKHLLT